jgi:hypothetical protein
MIFNLDLSGNLRQDLVVCVVKAEIAIIVLLAVEARKRRATKASIIYILY